MTKAKKNRKITVSARISPEVKELLDLSPYNVREHLEMNLGIYGCSKADSERKRCENELEVCIDDIRSKRREKRKLEKKLKEINEEEEEVRNKKEEQKGSFNLGQARVWKEVSKRSDNRALGVMKKNDFLKLCDQEGVDANRVYHNMSPELKLMVDWYKEVY